MIKSSRIINAVDPNLEPLLAALRRFRSAFLAGSLEFFIRTNLTVPQCRDSPEVAIPLKPVAERNDRRRRHLHLGRQLTSAHPSGAADGIEGPALGDREIGPDEELQAPGEKGRTEAPKGCKQRLQIRIHSINDST